MGSGGRGMGSAERVERVALVGEWGAGNEWGEQRCPGNGERGTSAVGSGDGRMGSGERWNGVTDHAASCPATLFLSFVLYFYFLKKNDDGDVSRPIVVGLSV